MYLSTLGYKFYKVRNFGVYCCYLHPVPKRVTQVFNKYFCINRK